MITRRKLLKKTALAGAALLTPGTAFSTETALSAGYFYPAEDLPHERTFMQWPVNPAVHD